jgi:hypothetical protein
MSAYSDGFDRFRQQLDAAGMVEGYVDENGMEMEVESITRLGLPADNRPAWSVCQLCLRTMKRRSRAELRPGVMVCRLCASLEQDPVLGIDPWLRMSLEARRTWIALVYGVDPKTMKAAESSTEEARLPLDADGLPLGVTRVVVPTGYRMVGMPRSFWTVVKERGRGVVRGAY